MVKIRIVSAHAVSPLYHGPPGADKGANGSFFCSRVAFAKLI
jgi:hypothetical protein